MADSPASPSRCPTEFDRPHDVTPQAVGPQAFARATNGSEIVGVGASKVHVPENQ